MSYLRARCARSRGRAARVLVLSLVLLAPGCGSGDEAPPEVPPGIHLPEVGTLGRQPRGPGTIVVDVTAEGRISIGGKGPLSLLALSEELKRRTADPAWREPDRSSLKILLVNADASLPWTVAVWILQTAADPSVALYRTFFGACERGGGAAGAIGCALPKNIRWGPVDWVDPPPRLAVVIVPQEGPPSEPEDLLAPLRAAAGKRPMADLFLDLKSVRGKTGEIPTGFMVRLVDVALRAGVKNIAFEGALRAPSFDAGDVEGLLDHVAMLRERLASPVLKVHREVVGALPSSEPVPDARGLLAHLYGFGVEEEEPSPEPAEQEAELRADLLEEEIDEEIEDLPFVEDPVIKDEEIVDPVETDCDLPYEEGLVDAPFVRPPPVIDRPAGAFPTRKREGEREVAVEAALRWLAAHQSPNGGWEAAGFGRWCHGASVLEVDRVGGGGRAQHDVGVTGLALCAFLGAGYTTRGRHPYAKTVSKGLRYLKNVQDAEGCFGPRTHRDYVYDHAAAALAMVEAYGMTHSPIFKSSALKALEFTLGCRNPGGAWGYGVASGESTASATGWLVLPLVVARWVDAEAVRRERTAPFGLDLTTAFDDTYAWLEHEQATTPVAILLRILLGEDPQASKAIRRGAAQLVARAPRSDDAEAIDHADWYFGSLALHQVGGEPWRVWDAALRDVLHAAQHRDEDPCHYEGSWDPSGRWAETRGRVAATAMLAMCLEVPYRYGRVFDAR